jgi:hypothetical protein
VPEPQSRQVDCGSADDGPLGEEAPDFGPLQEAAEAAELAEATAGLTDGSGGPLPAEDPLRPLAYAIARALTEAGFARHRWDRPRFDSQARVRCRSRTVGKGTQDTTQTGDECGQLLDGGGVEDFL